MYKKGAENDKQGKDAGNRTLCPYRNFSQAIRSSNADWETFSTLALNFDLEELESLKSRSLGSL